MNKWWHTATIEHLNFIQVKLFQNLKPNLDLSNSSLATRSDTQRPLNRTSAEALVELDSDTPNEIIAEHLFGDVPSGVLLKPPPIASELKSALAEFIEQGKFIGSFDGMPASRDYYAENIALKRIRQSVPKYLSNVGFPEYGRSHFSQEILKVVDLLANVSQAQKVERLRLFLIEPRKTPAENWHTHPESYVVATCTFAGIGTNYLMPQKEDGQPYRIFTTEPFSVVLARGPGLQHRSPSSPERRIHLFADVLEPKRKWYSPF